MNQETNTLNNFKIYRNNKFDYKANIVLKIRTKGPVLLQKIDDGFNRLYEI